MDFLSHLYSPNNRSLTRFLSGMIAYLGLAFHPDTYAEEYIRINEDGSESRIFDATQCSIINENLKTAHGFYGEAIYDKSNTIVNALRLINR